MRCVQRWPLGTCDSLRQLARRVRKNKRRESTREPCSTFFLGGNKIGGIIPETRALRGAAASKPVVLARDAGVTHVDGNARQVTQWTEYLPVGVLLEACLGITSFSRSDSLL